MQLEINIYNINIFIAYSINIFNIKILIYICAIEYFILLKKNRKI